MSVLRTMFTKQNVIDLLKTTRSSLDYLEKMEIVAPIQVSKFKHYYTWQQIRELKVICKLKENGVTTSRIKQNKSKISLLLVKKDSGHKIVSYNKNIYFVEEEEEIKLAAKLTNYLMQEEVMFTTITGEKVGQPPLPVVYNIDELCNELLQDGNRLIPDFEQRLNGDYIPVLRNPS